ncbi:hypothetical protein [Mucilaginibacter sp. L196]|uniref:hypothetical protein n=1 Tax=Mucilaginibacter sp. L196 TaxID=1641870 RepID=UPI00131B9E12|nr:hypothetical protein [Mucilaginibacter sp. L196]
MRTFILLCLTCIIGTGAFLSALSAQNKLPAFLVGFGVWILFLYYFVKKISR